MSEPNENFHRLAPRRPTLHLTPPRGWMNDPNGLCKIDGLWHVYYQHDPEQIIHGVMHWGHATSRDLVSWQHHPIALTPDDLGVIFSGSVVVDAENTAGFGAGAAVAVFTHYLDGVQSQSLAFSLDGGFTWSKYRDNPVLTSSHSRTAGPIAAAGTPANFRDPKVTRTNDGWLMALAVGDRVEFFASTDLRSWHQTGEYSYSFGDQGVGVWECPDLIDMGPGAHPRRTHLLTFCAERGGPNGHSSTLAVPGSLQNGEFVAATEPVRFDHGPDVYATQSFEAGDEPAPVTLSWLSSWRYSATHPCREYRGTMSLARAIGLSADGSVVQRPCLGHTVTERIDGRAWSASPDSGLVIDATGDVSIDIHGPFGASVTVTIAGQPGGTTTAQVTRHGDQMAHYGESYRAEVAGDGAHRIVIDHGTIEVFADSGRTALSALFFAGPDWQVDVDGAAKLHEVRPRSSSSRR